MKPIRQFRPILFSTLVLALLACAAVAGLSASQTEPEDGATLSRPPTALRVWFSEAPEVDKSELTLEGPTGAMDLEGLHTMGADDLMVRIVGKVVDGDYKATWKTVDSAGQEQMGEWSFVVKRGG